MDILAQIGACGIIPVVVIDEAQAAVPTAQALMAGDINIMEITLRTPASLAAIRQVAGNCPDICIGAGTVLTVEQGEAAVQAGAKFIVSPGFDLTLVKWCIAHHIVIIPGCVTPTEITGAIQLGLTVLKFFPAGIYGGLEALRALSAPFEGVQFIPTGGISDKNLAEYLHSPQVYAVGGSWMCRRSDIKLGNYTAITHLCHCAREIKRSAAPAPI